jgi:DNA-binding response OmpR family regulator
MQNVLLIDDDIDVFRLVQVCLKYSYNLLHASSLLEAEDLLKTHRPEVVILDINLGDGSGLDFLQSKINFFQDHSIQVIMLSERKELDSKLSSFDRGAIDYISKPFEPLELLARVQIALKKKNDRTLLQKGDIKVDLNTQMAFVDEERLNLSPLELKLLVYFINNENEILNRDQLITDVWGKDITVTDRTVDQHVSKLRKKLTTNTHQINTEHGKGYLFSKK